MKLWPKKQPTPPPTVTNASHRRWLRAGRPPWLWFHALPAVEQEQLALIGDDHARDLALAAGWAVRDPEAAEAAVAAEGGDASAEESMARRIAGEFAAKLLARREGRAAAPTMAGVGARRVAAAAAPRPAGAPFGGRPEVS
ncbi:MAG TPA: hypothetical protein VNM34_15075 [Verrucomicrobiae bacterium]|nr:hypothetical protein [Verrucomicrobiae bacterium]